MKKLFLYIDESKDFPNNLLYLGGLMSTYGFHLMNTYCSGFVPLEWNHELKSTRQRDREWYAGVRRDGLDFTTHIEVFSGLRNTGFEDFLIAYIEKVLFSHENVSDIQIYADFTRLDRDMIRYSKVFSRKLSNHLDRHVRLEFRPSHLYRSLQFADLEVGIYRKTCEQKKTQKSSAVDVS